MMLVDESRILGTALEGSLHAYIERCLATPWWPPYHIVAVLRHQGTGAMAKLQVGVCGL